MRGRWDTIHVRGWGGGAAIWGIGEQRGAHGGGRYRFGRDVLVSVSGGGGTSALVGYREARWTGRTRTLDQIAAIKLPKADTKSSSKRWPRVHSITHSIHGVSGEVRHFATKKKKDYNETAERSGWSVPAYVHIRPPKPDISINTSSLIFTPPDRQPGSSSYYKSCAYQDIAA